MEKPDFETAKQMLASDNFVWNAGIFLFRAEDMINSFQVSAPAIYDFVLKSIETAYEDLGFLRLSPGPWSMLENISVDYAIMEKSENLVSVPFKSKWSDLGGWDAVWSESIPDRFGNVASENGHAIRCSNTLLRSESNSQQIFGIGLDNILTIAMPDAVLVAHKNCAQEVQKAVELLKANDIAQAEVYPKDHRPWGWFESLATGNQFQVKRICVNPGAALSLQSHEYRSEHWVVVEGIAKVTIQEETQIVNQGQSVYVPLGAKHRLENPGDQHMILIEVQIGDYLGGDDIVRYHDYFNR